LQREKCINRQRFGVLWDLSRSGSKANYSCKLYSKRIQLFS
jgi:hypothetical protein